MKKSWTLLLVLLAITILGCVSKTKITHEIKLPPKPQREEIQPPKDLKDVAYILNYYEHLVEHWEEWGAAVETIVDESNEK